MLRVWPFDRRTRAAPLKDSFESGADDLERISPTAALMAYFRAYSDITFAKEIAELTSAESHAKNILKDAFVGAQYMAVMVEARFKKINACVAPFKNHIEIAAGFSPRSLLLRAEHPDIRYILVDLPIQANATEAVLAEICRRHRIENRNFTVSATNVLHPGTLASVADQLPQGLVAIISEGLLVYLTIEEKRSVLHNALHVLRKRGGAFITSDILMFDRNHPVDSPVLATIAKHTGRDIRELGFTSADEAKSFLTSIGYYVQVVNPAVDVTTLQTLGLYEDPRARFTANLPIWVLTAR